MARPPERDEQKVGAAFAADRPMAMYTPGREAVTYGRAGLWIAIGIIVVLCVVFFVFPLLWH